MTTNPTETNWRDFEIDHGQEDLPLTACLTSFTPCTPLF